VKRPALLALVSLALACGRDPADVPAVGTLERDRIELVAETDDPIVEIAVVEGATIAAGDLVVRQDDARMRAQVAALAAARDQAKARIPGAESTLATAQRDLQRARALARRDMEAKARLDAAQATHDEALARRDEARAALGAAEAALADATLRLERLRVRAPGAGRVDALPFEVGERPRGGAVVAVLLAEGAPYARVYVPQPLRVRLAEGARARVSIPSLDGEFEGRLRTISREAAFTPFFALTQYDRSRLAYVAEVDLDPEAGRALPTGIPVEVRFELGSELATRPQAVP
jgi:HlyD family secretion protein